MATLTITAPAVLPAGQIVATGLSAEAYMTQYADTHHEWVEGVVIKMSPQSLPHMMLVKYLQHVLDAYFALKPVGRVLTAPFVMRLDAVNSYREPDVLVLRHDNPSELTHTALVGPADICIEVVSPESATRDYGDKLIEYEQAGVREYWIVDPLRQRCDFNRRTESGVYAVIAPDENGHYRTPLLPRLALHVPTLWQGELPDLAAVMASLQAMLADE
ncbi:MAG: Uma2 family endonuclease [Anaerolineae bacterium]|nr:Uma2 family endonuclease [Anaerolineae bacterium]